ncbi:MAG: hypothetical protein Q4Q62_07520 [Thermoplasmata archaeon]|nr:hypothetical protein [Thermoplasmata archaeon]
MNKNTMIIAAVAVVAIVLVAAVVVSMGGNGSKSAGVPTASKLQIMGNANDDSTIDSEDMAILDSILAGTASLSDYPLADVNYDGTVNADDKALLQDIIDRKEGTTVYVLCLDVDGNDTVVPCEYPLRNIVAYGTNMQLPVLYANGGQYMAGYFNSSYDVAEASISSSAVDLKGSSRSISDAAWTNFMELDASLEGDIGAFLIDYSNVSQMTSARVTDLSDAGIPLIIYSSADAESELVTTLTLGFLFGGNSESLGVSYAQLGWDVLEYIDGKVGGLSDSERTSFICCTMYIYICQNDSTFNATPTSAGGIAYSKVNSSFASTYSGDSSTKMSSVEALSNYTDVGAVINNRSIDWGLTSAEVDETIVDIWEHSNDGTASYEFFTGLTDKLYYVNNLLPGGVRLAYAACALYGDVFTLEWAEDILQQYIDMGTAPLDGQSTDSIVAYFDLDMYNAAKA